MEGSWLISLIASLGAVGAAIGAWLAARETRKTGTETRKTGLAQTTMGIIDLYDTPEMGVTLATLNDWHERYGSNSAKKFSEMYPNDPEVKPYEKARRMFGHFFDRIVCLLDCGLVTEELVKKVIQIRRLRIFLEMVEPLEQIIRDKRREEDYDYKTGDTLRRIFRFPAREK